MWTVIYMAQDKKLVDKLKLLLEKHNIIVKVRPINRNTDEDTCCYEVLVPESEVSEAHLILIDAEL